jgi:hypothetical protein
MDYRLVNSWLKQSVELAKSDTRAALDAINFLRRLRVKDRTRLILKHKERGFPVDHRPIGTDFAANLLCTRRHETMDRLLPASVRASAASVRRFVLNDRSAGSRLPAAWT